MKKTFKTRVFILFRLFFGVNEKTSALPPVYFPKPGTAAKNLDYQKRKRP